MHIGLYFGSFNPIHIGHLIIANFMAENSDADKIWFVVSPQNPLKESASLLNEYDRMHLVELAVQDNPSFKASNIEFHLPRPSYTIDTLTYLKEKFPNYTFSVIMGSDSFQNIHRWKNFETLVQDYRFLIYKRPGFEVTETHDAQIQVFEAPLMDISSSFIRRQLKAKKSVRYMLPDNVEHYILENKYYL